MDINLVGFIPALLPVALSPGASFAIAINSALAGGSRGLITTLAGTALGIYTHAFLIGLGISAVLIKSPAAFDILKIAGTAWLLWLGIQLLRSGSKTRDEETCYTAAPITLKDAWLANVLNPKAIIFYLTVVTQFVGRSEEIVPFLLLATVHIAIISIWLLAVSKVLVFSARKANPSTLEKYVNTGGGIMLILFSVNSLFH